MTCDELWEVLGGFGDSTCNYSVAIRVNRVILVSLWTETMKFVEGNASVYQVKPVSPTSGEGRVWGGGKGGEFQQRDIQCVEVFITLADFDEGRLGESKGLKKKEKKSTTSPCIQA